MSGKSRVLTDNSIAKLKFNPTGPSIQRYWDAAQPGLHVTVYPAPGNKRHTGRRSFAVRFDSPDGKQRTKKIGEFPSISVAEARILAVKARIQTSTPLTVAEGYQLLQKNLHRLPMGTNSPHSLEMFYSGMRTHWLPVIGDQIVSEVTESTALAVIDRWVQKGKYGSAEAARAAIFKFYGNLWSFPEYRTTRNPLAGVEVFIPKFKRKRKVLTESEIRRVWETGCTILKMLLLTGQRIHPFIELRWDQVSDDTIRWETMKRRGMSRVLPITDSMRQLFDEQPRTSELVFTFNTELADSYTKRILRQAKLKITPHVLRHTFATLGIENGLTYEGIARVPHHTQPGMTAHYSRDAQALGIKRETLERWEEFVAEACTF